MLRLFGISTILPFIMLPTAVHAGNIDRSEWEPCIGTAIKVSGNMWKFPVEGEIKFTATLVGDVTGPSPDRFPYHMRTVVGNTYTYWRFVPDESWGCVLEETDLAGNKWFPRKLYLVKNYQGDHELLDSGSDDAVIPYLGEFTVDEGLRTRLCEKFGPSQKKFRKHRTKEIWCPSEEIQPTPQLNTGSQNDDDAMVSTLEVAGQYGGLGLQLCELLKHIH